MQRRNMVLAMISFFMEIMHYLKFHQGALLYQHQLKLNIVGSVDVNIHILLPQCVQI